MRQSLLRLNLLAVTLGVAPFCRFVELSPLKSDPSQRATGAESRLRVKNKPINEKCYSVRPPRAKVDTIVIHFCSDAVKNPEAPFDIDRIIKIFEDNGVSSHYIIARDGTVFRLVSEELKAFHAGKGEVPWAPVKNNKLNDTSIGIELLSVSTFNDMKFFMDMVTYAKVPESAKGFTEQQYESLRCLIEQICNRWPDVQKDYKHIFGHKDYAPGRRTDPGELFKWQQIGIERPESLEHRRKVGEP